MSRTRVHAPYWTWAAWFEATHGPRCPEWRYDRPRSLERRPCNLPERPGMVREPRYKPGVHRCTWNPIRPPWRQAEWLHLRPMPRWYVEHVWHNPERVRERDQLGKMVKEYNAMGDLDDGDFPTYRARHCASWWWD